MPGRYRVACRARRTSGTRTASEPTPRTRRQQGSVPSRDAPQLARHPQTEETGGRPSDSKNSGHTAGSDHFCTSTWSTRVPRLRRHATEIAALAVQVRLSPFPARGLRVSPGFTTVNPHPWSSIPRNPAGNQRYAPWPAAYKPLKRTIPPALTIVYFFATQEYPLARYRPSQTIASESRKTIPSSTCRSERWICHTSSTPTATTSPSFT